MNDTTRLSKHTRTCIAIRARVSVETVTAYLERKRNVHALTQTAIEKAIRALKLGDPETLRAPAPVAETKRASNG